MKEHFQLPLTDPVIIFAIVLFIILLAPIVLRRFKIPALVGLIVAGLLLGPNGFNILLRDSSIILFGTVGLLYIMFLAGLEIDLGDFKKNRNKSIVFGIFTFIIPMGLGTVVSYYLLNLSLPSSILLASMFASHTLLAYPIVSRLGLVKQKSVNVTVGGTIITDTAALLVLAVIAGSTTGELNNQFWFKLSISITIFGLLVYWGFPRLARMFFKNIEDSISQFIFVLGLVFLAAFLAELAGVEHIIGAFIAGLALNKLIPNTSPLMNRIEFVGNALFIPFFLISVGMLIDYKVLFKGPEALIVAATMIVIAILSKFIAAYFTQLSFKFSNIERNLIFGLSSAQAAATLAAVMVGFSLGLFDENILNGTILMILATSLVSSFATEKAGRKLALIESEKSIDMSELSKNRILVPISNPETIEQLIDFAILLRDKDSTEPIYPLTVVKDNNEAKEKIVQSRKMLERAIKFAAATDTSVQVVSRIDLNIANGIIRAINELLITDIVIGWNSNITTKDKIFGSVLDKLLKKSEQMVYVTRLIQPINTIKNLIVIVPTNAEFEIGFHRWLKSLKILAKHTSAKILFFTSETNTKEVKKAFNNIKPSAEAKFDILNDINDFLVLSRHISQDDLLVVISARKGTISYNSVLDKIPLQLSKYFEKYNFVILYPEQNKLPESESPYVSQQVNVIAFENETEKIDELDELVKKSIKYE